MTKLEDEIRSGGIFGMIFYLLITWFTFLPACACLQCYIEITTLDSGNVDWGAKPTTISDYYTPLIDQGVDPFSQTVWFFEVKACSDAGILLSTNPDLSGVLFEIIIDSYGSITWTNSPTIRQHKLTGPVLSCSSFTRFWLSWNPEGAVSFGAGDAVGLNPYFTTAATHSTAFGGIGINSCWGNNGEWRYGIPSNLPVPDSCPTVQTTELSSMSSELRPEPTTTDLTYHSQSIYEMSQPMTTVEETQSKFATEEPTVESSYTFSPEITEIATSVGTTKVTTDALDCTQTPPIPRTETTSGHFKKEASIQLIALYQIDSSIRCSLISCARSCLSYSKCWYFRFDMSGFGCQPCLLYDSSVNPCIETGPVDGHLYKWV